MNIVAHARLKNTNRVDDLATLMFDLTETVLVTTEHPDATPTMPIILRKSREVLPINQIEALHLMHNNVNEAWSYLDQYTGVSLADYTQLKTCLESSGIHITRIAYTNE